MESNSRPTDIRPYGKACSGCAKSKCKCVNRRDGGGCVRCHRLKKPCVPGASVRKTAAQNNNPVGRIARLESKLDGLVTALGVGLAMPANASPIIGDAESAVPAGAGQTPSSSDSSGGITSTTTPGAAYSRALVVDGTSIQSPPASETDLMASDFPTDVEECLRTFCHQMLKFFPFIQPPTDLCWVRRERPFLLICICAAASKSAQTRFILGDRIKRTVADRLVLNSHGVVNIDILLGLLVFIAWGHDALLKRAPNTLSRFTQLAMLVVFELRLNRQPTKETNMIHISSSQDSRTAIPGTEDFHSLEERRAVLGCFYLSSVISTYFGQIDAMQWTSYMEESLNILERSKECRSDESFVHQIRLQLISREMETVRHSTVPPHFYVRAMQTRLDGLKGAISPVLQDDILLLGHVYFTQLSIVEPAIGPDTPTTLRIEYLYTCLQVVKDGMENFLKVPATEYEAVPFSLFVQIVRYIKALIVLSTLNDSTWDTNMVRQTVDVLQFVDQVLSNIQTAKGSDVWSGDGYLAGASRVFAAVRAWCASELAESPVSFDHDPTDAWTANMFGAFAFEGVDFFT